MKNISVLTMEDFSQIRNNSYLFDTGNINIFIQSFTEKLGFTPKMKMVINYNSMRFLDFVSIVIADKNTSLTFNCSADEDYVNFMFHTEKPVPKEIIEKIIEHFNPKVKEYKIICEEKPVEEKIEAKYSWTKTQLIKYCKDNSIDVNESLPKKKLWDAMQVAINSKEDSEEPEE